MESQQPDWNSPSARKLRRRLVLYIEVTEEICRAIGVDGIPDIIKKEWRNRIADDDEAQHGGAQEGD